jgi:hypothetical protein
MPTTYPQSHMVKVMILDGLIFCAGLMALATPIIHGFFPGDVDTTAHVAIGALVCLLAAFRVLLAYGAAWMEPPLFVLGLITVCLPRIMHMRWDEQYAMGHYIFGGAIMALAVISVLLTIPAARKAHATR